MNLVRQTSLYLVANIASAVFGLINVTVFTRLLPPSTYGVYVVAIAFSTVLGALLYGWLKQAILREESKGAGGDVRPTVLIAYVASTAVFPLVYAVAACLLDMDTGPTLAAMFLTMAVGYFEMGLEVARARFEARRFMVATVLRAVLMSLSGVAVILAGGGSIALLFATAGAYLACSFLVLRPVWRGTRLARRDPRLYPLFLWGLPLTFSISLLALQQSLDRFVLAGMLGTGAAGEYGAAVDLVRQALVVPAVSVASAFMPMAVRILAQQGAEATRLHLGDCLEFLLATVLPACIGYALVSPAVAALVLGDEYRDTANLVMPLVAVTVIFQVTTNQYLHISYLLGDRNSFYMINTMVMLVLGVVTTIVGAHYWGVAGVIWARLATEAVGTLTSILLSRRAFRMPFPALRVARICGATAAMTIAVTQVQALLGAPTPAHLIAVIPAGVVVYAGACWAFDIASFRSRSRHVLGRIGSRLRSA